MNKFGIIGYGFVGQSTHKGLIYNAEVSVHDIKYHTDISVLSETDVVFCCLPTDDRNDIAQLITELKDLKETNSSAQIVLRSTVPVGTCNRIEQETDSSIIYIPEFLRERFWETDCMRRPVIVGNNSASMPKFLENIEKEFCSLEEAEILKMFSNNYATLRIAFANSFYDLSQKQNGDYNKIKNMFFKIQQDQTYMEVPGHDGKRGFGGKCLPKDLDFLIETLDTLEIDSRIFKYIREQNEVWNNLES